MATNLPSWCLIQFLEQLLKFPLIFALLKYVKSQRSYGFFDHKRADFLASKFWIFYHISASLNFIFEQNSYHYPEIQLNPRIRSPKIQLDVFSPMLVEFSLHPTP